MKHQAIADIEVQIADSFVKINKISRGHGEARLYIGSNKRNWKEFFEKFPCLGFFEKQDLINYLDKCKFEYEEQSQGYFRDISKYWTSYKEKIQKNREEVIYFNFEEANGVKDKERFYIRSKDKIFSDLFRSFLLPIITSLRICKVQVPKRKEKEFYFYPYLKSYEAFNIPQKIEKEEEKIKENLEIKETTRKQLIDSRRGQGIFRDRIINEFFHCLFTKVDDERLLIAGHIKPWSLCDNKERLDGNNGILLSPTYDKLFGLGFITFNNEGKLLISNHISGNNSKKLNLNEMIKNCKLKVNEMRKKYLEFHRKQIFKK